MPEAQTQFPMRIGRPDEFSRVRDFFRRAGFDEAAVCAALGIEKMSDVERVRWEDKPLSDVPALLRWCIEAFVRCAPVPQKQSLALCGPETFAAVLSLGLLR